MREQEGKTMVVWSIGEILWDVFSGHEQLGGAPLNFSANVQRLGERALFLSAVGKDKRGQLALERMTSLCLSTEGVREVEEFETGVAIVTTRANGESTFVIPRPAAFDKVAIDPQLLEESKAGSVNWLYFGTLVQTEPEVEGFIADLLRELNPARCFYDINLRTGHWNLELVQRLSERASMVKLNEAEAETLFKLTDTEDEGFSLETFCRTWAVTYGIETICVTLGPAGCLVYDKGVFTQAGGYTVTVCDTVGSGDAFAAAFLHGYSRGWPMEQTARFANALGALVASRAGATPDWTVDEVLGMMKG